MIAQRLFPGYRSAARFDGIFAGTLSAICLTVLRSHGICARARLTGVMPVFMALMN